MSREVNTPFLVRDVTLMSPGIWNGWDYSAEELKKAYDSTDWSDEHISSLFLDHPDNPHNAARDWIGRVKNSKQMTDGTIKGDLEIWDEDIVYKLSVAKAKFGVSPRVVGTEDKENMCFIDFFFDNFSIVSKPAQSTATINLAERLKFLGVIKQLSVEQAKKELVGDPELMSMIIMKLKQGIQLTEEEMQYILETFSHFGILDEKMEEMARHGKMKKKKNKSNMTYLKKLKGGKNLMAEENEKTEEKEEEKKEEEPEKSEDSESEKSDSTELSDANVLNIISEDMDGFNSYTKDIRKSDPNVSLKDLAKKFKIYKERLGFIEELSESEALDVLKKLSNRLGSSKDKVSIKKENSGSKELSEKIDNLEKTIKELSKTPKVAKPKTVKGASTPVDTGFNMVGKPAGEGVQELAHAIMNR